MLSRLHMITLNASEVSVWGPRKYECDLAQSGNQAAAERHKRHCGRSHEPLQRLLSKAGGT